MQVGGLSWKNGGRSFFIQSLLTGMGKFAQNRSIRFLIFIWLGLVFTSFLSACSSNSIRTRRYAYPSPEQNRVKQFCTALYSPPYVEYIAPSRKRKVKYIESKNSGLLAVFSDGHSYRVPLQTGLPPGEVFYCNYRPEPTPCASDQNWDQRCLKDQPYRPGLFSF